jgi:hypothetical protein
MVSPCHLFLVVRNFRLTAVVHRRPPEFSQKTKDRMELLRKRSDSATVTEVIRRAVALFDLYTEARNDGYDLIFRKADGSEEQVVKALF